MPAFSFLSLISYVTYKVKQKYIYFGKSSTPRLQIPPLFNPVHSLSYHKVARTHCKCKFRIEVLFSLLYMTRSLVF